MSFKELIEKIRYSVPINFIRNTAKKIVLPGFEGMSLYEGTKFTLEAFMRSDIATKSASISFRLFIALFPTVILILSLVPYIPIDDFQENLIGQLFSILPDTAYQFISGTVEDLVMKKHTAVLSIGFILTLYYASNMINAILNTLSSSYQIEVKRNPIKQRLISFVLMIAISVLMLSGFAIIFFGEAYLDFVVSDWEDMGDFAKVAISIVKYIAVILLFIIAISTLYNVALIERKKWKIISSGASLATLGIILASLGFSYFVNNFGAYNKLYGSIGSLIVFLISINVSSTILIVGFELYAKTNNKNRAINE